MRTALRRARLRAGLTQAEVARLAGLSRSAYTNIEKGNKDPSLVTALRIASVLNEYVEELFADDISGNEAVGPVRGNRTRDESGGRVVGD